MNKHILAILLWLCPAILWGQSLYFSKYVEGKGYDKALEIHNLSSNPVNLSNYKIEVDTDGKGFGSGQRVSELRLSGTLGPYSSYLMVRAVSKNNELKFLADTLLKSNILNFNGNEQIRLSEIDPRDGRVRTVDLIGYPGSSNNMKDMVLVRRTYYAPNFGEVQSNLGDWHKKSYSDLSDLKVNYKPSNSLTSIDKSKVVGSIAGSAGVSGSGAASYQIPISVLPGVNGLQPQLAIVYNSQGGNGLLGKAWNLSGLSAISRVPQSIYQDGATYAVGFNNYDRLALDGNRLVSLSDDYWASSAEYRTEMESFSKITKHGSGSSMYFQVETKDGKILEYGKNTSAREFHSGKKYSGVKSWLLNKISDQYGNEIVYNYTKHVDYCLIDNITYNGTTIQFIYTTNRNVIQQQAFDEIISVNHLLTEIRINRNAKTLYAYQLEYNKNDSNDTDELVKVIQYNSNQEEKNPTQIVWKHKDEFNFESVSIQGIEESFSDQSYTAIDYNGDGLDDLIGTYDNGSKDKVWRVYINKSKVGGSTSFSPNNDILVIDKNKVNDKHAKINCGIIAADLNGNGKPSVYLPSWEASNLGIALFFKNLDSDSPDDSIEGFNNFSKIPFLLTTDFDLDGKQEIFYFEERTDANDESNMGVVTLSESGSSLKNSSCDAAELDSKFYNVLPLYGDYNVNGKPDILFFTDGGIKLLEEYYVNGKRNGSFKWSHWSDEIVKENSIVRTGDFNGDGVNDLIISYADGNKKMKVLCSRPLGSDRSSKQIDLYSLNDNRTDNDDDLINIIVTDFNKDGKDDFITYDADYDRKHDGFKSYYRFNKMVISYYQSSGNSFSKVESKSISNSSHTKASYYVSGDFNGDGHQDVMNYGYQYLKEYNSQIKWRILTNIDKDFDNGLVTDIVDGLGNKSSFSYRPLTDVATVKTSQWSNELSDVEGLSLLRAPLYVLSKMSTSNGIGGENTTEYSYDTPLLHRQGRGFLGFLQTTAENTTTNVKEISQFEVNSDYIINSLKEKEIFSKSDLVSRITNTYEIVAGTEKSFFNAVKKIVEYNGATKSTNTTKDRVFDKYGNLSSQTTEYGSGNDVSVTITNTYSDEASWCLNRLQSSSQTTKYKNAASFTQSSSFTYNDKGKLMSKTESGITTTYSDFDSYGNAQEVSVSAAGASTRVSKYKYDDDFHSFVKESINPLEQSEKFEYNEWGQLTKNTDIAGLETSYEYDAWGQLTGTIYPNGKRSTHSIAWAPDNIFHSLYYTQTSSEGAPYEKIFYDQKGRVTGSETEGYNGLVYSRQKYNNKGQVISAMSPHYEGGIVQLTTTRYNRYGQILESNVNNVITSYSYSGLTTTINSPRGKVVKKHNALGDVLSSKDANNKYVVYNYHSSGQAETINVNNSQVEIDYDSYGLQNSLTDPDAGTISYQYNGFGELVAETDNKNNTTTIQYDHAGRIIEKVIGGVSYNYQYYDSGNGIGLLKKVSISNGDYSQYAYDQYGMPVYQTEMIDGESFTTEYEYDEYNRLSEMTYPSGLTIEHTYNSLGFLQEVKNTAQNKSIWKINAYNANGQARAYYSGNGKLTQKTFDNDGYLTGIKTGFGSIQNLKYTFSSNTGNLLERQNLLHKRTERFTYDKLNRLTSSTIGNETKDYHYDHSGNITYKTHVGDYEYDGKEKGPHAVSAISNEDDLIHSSQTIKYNAFNKVEEISQDERRMLFRYGSDLQRSKTQLLEDNSVIMTKYFVGNYEKKIMGGSTEHISYIHAGDGLAAIHLKKDGEEKMLYVHKDHLGSIQALSCDETNVNGGLVEEFSYDPWGKRRFTNADGFNENFNYSDLCRGYTGHEHLHEFGLINMNGRLYDPLLGRFLSPDNYVQMPDFTQNYNRFAYCLNNPLIYIDPTGQKSWLGKFTSWVGDGWDAMWEAGEQFAVWAAQNNISGNFGVTYNGAGNIGATGSLNGQPLDLNGETASIDRGVANAGISLFNQFAQMSGGSTGYRPLDRGLIPFVNAEPLIFNGAWYYDPSNPIFNYSLEQAQFNAWCQRASGRVELTDSPIDFLLGAGIGKAIFKGSSRLVGGVVTKTSSKLAGRVAAKGGQTIVGEGMKRVSAAAAKNPGSTILNNMPKFSGSPHQVTSQMMQYNRKWLLQQMRSGKPIMDIGLDPTRGAPSIFYQMEQRMINNYLKLHPNAFKVIKP